LTKTDELYNVPRGTAYLTSQQILLYLTYLVFYVLLARILNSTEVGEFAVLAGIQALFTGIVSGSFPSAATRFISRSIAKGDFSAASGVARTTLRLSLAVAVPALVLALVFSPYGSRYLGGFVNPTNLLLATFVSAFFADLMLLYTAFFIGVGRYAQTLYQNLLYVPLSRGLALALAYLGLRVFGLMAGWAIGGGAAILLSLYMWHGRLPRGGSYPLRPIVSFSTSVFASSLVTLGQSWGDIGIIYVLLGATILGPYYLVVSSVTFLSVLWTPVNQAIYPALSAAHSTGDVRGVSDRLAASFRLINLTVLPLGAALAAISPTALEIVYGTTYTSQALTLSILSVTSVLLAQGALLITTLQAVGHTRQYLGVTLASTLIFLGFVWTGAPYLGTLAGAIGRALLSLLIVLFSIIALRKTVATGTSSSMRKAIPLAAAVALPLLAVDQYFFWFPRPSFLRPSVLLAILFVMFVALFVFFSRQLRVFHHGDFAMLHDVLPKQLRPLLKRIQRLMAGEEK
jgi:O-antigen/teichoic acid export membrane protein